MIQHLKNGFMVMSEKGKPLSKKLKIKAAATKRLRQVEMFKHMNMKGKS